MKEVTRRRDAVCEQMFAASLPPTEEADRAMRNTLAWQWAEAGDALESLARGFVRVFTRSDERGHS